MQNIGHSRIWKGGDYMELTFMPPNAKQKLFMLDKHKHVAFGGA